MLGVVERGELVLEHEGLVLRRELVGRELFERVGGLANGLLHDCSRVHARRRAERGREARGRDLLWRGAAAAEGADGRGRRAERGRAAGGLVLDTALVLHLLRQGLDTALQVLDTALVLHLLR